MRPRLGARTLPLRYARDAHGVGIVHLGIGAFHRAHQAAYVDELLAREGGDWRILGVSLRSPAVRDQLAPQDGLYTLVERGPEGDRARIVGAVAGVLVAPENPEAVIAALAAPTTHIVTLTITEKGYLPEADMSRTAVGYLVASLARRRAAGVAAPTIISCDNLPENGRVLRAALTGHAQRVETGLADWIEANVAFPSTMVDRIVPATTEQDIARLAVTAGYEDQAMVKAEPFGQWVIEDRFAGPRPALERVGVQIVPDVRPFERAKLRMLNGAHSTLAYLGLLLGYSFVHQAIADSAPRALIDQLMRGEAARTLAAAPGLDLDAYADALIERFANPAMDHRLIQIAMDGSQKLPQRLLRTIADLGLANAPVALLAVAAWMVHASGPGVDDPLASRLASIAGARGNDACALVRRLLAIEEIFAGSAPDLADALVPYVEALRADPRACIDRAAAALPERIAA